MKFPLPTIAVVFVISANLCSGQGAPDMEQLFARSRAEYKKAWDLERNGKPGKALPLYEEAARLGDDYWAAAERAGLSDEQRRPDIYYAPAMAHLNAAAILAKMPGQSQRLDQHCLRCIEDLGRAAKIENNLAAKRGTKVSANAWKIFHATAFAHFLQGDLATARQQYGFVLKDNPTYQPAKDAILEINKLEEEQFGRYTPQGPKKPTQDMRKKIGEAVATVKLAKDVFEILRSLVGR